MYLIQLLDWYSASISVILVCIVEVVAVAWIYGCDNFVRDVQFMIDRKVERCWRVLWKYVTPILLSVCISIDFLDNPRLSRMICHAESLYFCLLLVYFLHYDCLQHGGNIQQFNLSTLGYRRGMG